MKVYINRYPSRVQEFEVNAEGCVSLLDLLYRIREEMDPSLAFRSMCRAGICGTCAVKLNGKPVLACSIKVPQEESILIEPIGGYRVIKDLVVEHEDIYQKLRDFKIWLRPSDENSPISEAVNLKTWGSWECILCGICDSVCPLLQAPSDFGGPVLLTRAHKHAVDPRNKDSQSILGSIQSLRPDLCTHCMNCSYSCPKRLMPESLIREEEGILSEKGLLQRPLGGFDFLSF
ncbi:MAG: 2Fe-2S iron-sulfur cluster-binding protein [Aquificaceae bacterium]|nr:2Fe-2S iron-sulfur cluster-binding protein [Aquificaceae bacterium]